MKIAVVQMDVRLGEKGRNVQAILDRLETASQNGANVVIFPECAVTGYCFDSLEEAMPQAEGVPGSSTERISRAAKERNCTVVVGMLEREGDKLYNAAAVLGPGGILGSYRKAHLPFLGIDRFATPGDRPFPLFPIPAGQLGINICYDCSFPEAGRVPKLKGAQVLAIPTNWPVNSDLWEHVPKVRAVENHMIVAVADRVGEERGFRFAGHSQIIDFTGKVFAEAGETEETILYADVDLAAADRNRILRIPGKHEIDRIADRRPELYGALLDPR
ncbi:MAG TPA: carbon-nitrogen hydrolase family protein [Terriglobia bacterium]|nr:carbon-nitrogen hydrolase family protein [Terriglobia bacterium]